MKDVVGPCVASKNKAYASGKEDSPLCDVAEFEKSKMILIRRVSFADSNIILAQLATKGVLGEVVTTCERSQVRVSSRGAFLQSGNSVGLLPDRWADSRLA
ncbi:hypothetical protein Tco_0724192 [Tanacetum coccineum]